MPLITTIEQVIENGVKVNFMNEGSSLADMQAAEERFLLPILGQTLYQTILSEANNAESDFNNLIAKARRALAPLAYWLELPHIQTQITDRGLATSESENMKAAYRWQYEAMRESLADKGCFALEKMLEHLYEKQEDYGWEQPAKLKLIFTSGAQFAEYCTIFQPHRTFENLRPIIRQIEDQYIRNTIGDNFFESLRDNNNPGVEDKKVIELIRLTVANLAIHRAVEVLPAKISSEGFTVALRDAADSVYPKDQHARNEQLSLLYHSAKQSGETYLVKLADYLNKTASATVFQIYFQSEYYTAPDTVVPENPNAIRNGIFGL